jgi:hypothetical protein
MNILKFLHELPMIPNIAIVGALLPEVLSLADQSPRHTLLQGLERIGQRPMLRFPEQRVDVLRHHHIPVDAQTGAASDPLQRGLERSLADGR